MRCSGESHSRSSRIERPCGVRNALCWQNRVPIARFRKRSRSQADAWTTISSAADKAREEESLFCSRIKRSGLPGFAPRRPDGGRKAGTRKLPEATFCLGQLFCIIRIERVAAIARVVHDNLYCHLLPPLSGDQTPPPANRNGKPAGRFLMV